MAETEVVIEGCCRKTKTIQKNNVALSRALGNKIAKRYLKLIRSAYTFTELYKWSPFVFSPYHMKKSKIVLAIIALRSATAPIEKKIIVELSCALNQRATTLTKWERDVDADLAQSIIRHIVGVKRQLSMHGIVQDIDILLDRVSFSGVLSSIGQLTVTSTHLAKIKSKSMAHCAIPNSVHQYAGDGKFL